MKRMLLLISLNAFKFFGFLAGFALHKNFVLCSAAVAFEFVNAGALSNVTEVPSTLKVFTDDNVDKALTSPLTFVDLTLSVINDVNALQLEISPLTLDAAKFIYVKLVNALQLERSPVTLADDAATYVRSVSVLHFEISPLTNVWLDILIEVISTTLFVTLK